MRNTNKTSSFFAFQDIITSTIGILLMITLILVITLVTGKLEEVEARKGALEQEARTITEANQRFLELQTKRNQQTAALQQSLQTYRQKEQLLAEYLQSDILDLERKQISQRSIRKIKLSDRYDRFTKPLMLTAHCNATGTHITALRYFTFLPTKTNSNG